MVSVKCPHCHEVGNVIARACVSQDQITVLTQTLSALTQFVTGFVSNTTACILEDPLCSTCLNPTTCKTCREVRQIRLPCAGMLLFILRAHQAFNCHVLRPKGRGVSANAYCKNNHLMSEDVITSSDIWRTSGGSHEMRGDR